MDEELVETDVPSVGERLARRARGEKMSASRTSRRRPEFRSAISKASRVGDWDALPAPTYTIGFAKSYATAVGLDRTEIGDQLRDRNGRPARPPTTAAEVFEPADPRADHAQVAGVRGDRRGHPARRW